MHLLFLLVKSPISRHEPAGKVAASLYQTPFKSTASALIFIVDVNQKCTNFKQHVFYFSNELQSTSKPFINAKKKGLKHSLYEAWLCVLF